MEMKINQLNAREVRKTIQRGLGIIHLCTKYECTEEELKAQIGRIYKRNDRDRDDIIVSLVENDHKASKKSITAEAIQEKAETTEMIEVAESTEVIDITKVPIDMLVVKDLTLEQLIVLEKIWSKATMDLESEHKALTRKHHGFADKIRHYKKQLGEIKSQLRRIKQEFDGILKEDAVLIERSVEISSEHNKNQVKLDEMRARINFLTKVVIYVYDDGTIASENPEIILDDSGNEDLYLILRENAECENLRLKEIKILAKVLQIIKHLSDNYEIVFDNAEIEEVFKKLSA